MFTDLYVSYSEGDFSILLVKREADAKSSIHSVHCNTNFYNTIYMIIETDHTKTFAIKC